MSTIESPTSVQQTAFTSLRDFCDFIDELAKQTVEQGKGRSIGFSVEEKIDGHSDFYGQVVGIYLDRTGASHLVLHDRTIAVKNIDLSHISYRADTVLLGPIDPKEDLVSQARTGPESQIFQRLAELVEQKHGLLTQDSYLKRTLPPVQAPTAEEVEEFLSRLSSDHNAVFITSKGETVKFRVGMVKDSKDGILLVTAEGPREIPLAEIVDFVCIAPRKESLIKG